MGCIGCPVRIRNSACLYHLSRFQNNTVVFQFNDICLTGSGISFNQANYCCLIACESYICLIVVVLILPFLFICGNRNRYRVRSTGWNLCYIIAIFRCCVLQCHMNIKIIIVCDSRICRIEINGNLVLLCMSRTQFYQCPGKTIFICYHLVAHEIVSRQDICCVVVSRCVIIQIFKILITETGAVVIQANITDIVTIIKIQCCRHSNSCLILLNSSGDFLPIRIQHFKFFAYSGQDC